MQRIENIVFFAIASGMVRKVGPFLVSSHYFGERKTDQVGKSVLL